MAVFEIIATAEDRASGVLEGIGDKGSKAAQGLSKHWKKLTVAGAALGGGLEMLARRGQETELNIMNLASSTNMTEKEVRGLTVSLIDATFPLEDVNALLEIGRQRGLKSADQLEDFARFWDMVGDATGEASDQLAKASFALGAVGVDTEDPSEALEALGFITVETSSSVGEFLQFLERTGMELREMGVSVNEAAAILGVLEHELDMSGRVARQEFQKAVNESDGSLQSVMKTLGVTADEMEKYTDLVGESGEVMKDLSDNAGEVTTVMQWLGAEASKLGVRFGDTIAKVADFAPALMAIGPGIGIIKGLAGAKTLLAAAATKAWIAVLGPIALVLLAIAAVGAAVYLVIKHWDKITAFFGRLWDGVKNIFDTAWDWIVDGAKWAANVIIGFLNAPMKGLEMLINGIGRAVNALPSIRIPDLPGIPGRGKEISLPTFPTVSLPMIPTLHSGGIFRAPKPGGEGLALLRDKERVIPPERSGEGRVIVDQRGLFEGAHITLWDRESAEGIAEELYGITRSRLRSLGTAYNGR